MNFKIGDKVKDSRADRIGIISYIENNRSAHYPIKVTFKGNGIFKDNVISYDLEGYYYTSIERAVNNEDRRITLLSPLEELL
jgi:hypothetical protein